MSGLSNFSNNKMQFKEALRKSHLLDWQIAIGAKTSMYFFRADENFLKQYLKFFLHFSCFLVNSHQMISKNFAGQSSSKMFSPIWVNFWGDLMRPIHCCRIFWCFFYIRRYLMRVQTLPCYIRQSHKNYCYLGECTVVVCHQTFMSRVGNEFVLHKNSKWGEKRGHNSALYVHIVSPFF